MRTDATAFSNPFAYFAQQKTWNRQVNNAYLLGLEWEISAKLSILKAKLDKLDDANTAIEEGALSDFGGTVGEMESEKINLEAALATQVERLKKFQVYEDYADVQIKADELTREIHNLLNTTNVNTQVIAKYKASLTKEQTQQLRVEDIYRETGVIFPTGLKRTLEEVNAFHETVINNRRQYLRSEIKELEAASTELEKQIKTLSEERSSYMGPSS